MSLDKAIEHHKERRRSYKGAKAVDKTCRNHGSCDWCKSNRLHNSKKIIASAESQLEEYREHGIESTENSKPIADRLGLLPFSSPGGS